MKSLKILLLQLVMLSLVSFAFGCANTKKPEMPAGTAADTIDPVTLTVFLDGTAISDLEFQKYFVETVQKKYPQVTLQLSRSSTGNTIQDRISGGGEVPDILYTSNTSLHRFIDLKIITDLNEYVKKSNFDTGKIRPLIMDSLKLYSDNGQLLGLPYTLNFAAWYYNKDIFDRFGVGYPKDLMTWDETLGLARQLTRNVDGVQYIGMDLTEPDRIGGQLSLPLVDKKTNKSLIDTDGWKKVLSFMKQNYDLPGYVDGTKWTYGTGAFMKTKNLAMLTNWADGVLGPLEEMQKKGDTMNWDWAALPNFKEELGTGREVDIHMLVIPTLSKNKEAAWKVMQHILSDEVQTVVAKTGRLPAIKNPEIEKQFGAELEVMKGKNSISNVLKAQPRTIHPPSEFDRDIVKKRLNDAAKAIAVEKKDVNTALREKQELADKQIVDELAKKK